MKTGDSHRHTSGSILAKERTGAERRRVWAVDGGRVGSKRQAKKKHFSSKPENSDSLISLPVSPSRYTFDRLTQTNKNDRVPV